MNHRHGQIRRCAVYHGRGETLSEACGCGDRPQLPVASRRTIADTVPLRQIMSNELICARADLRLRAVVKLMLEHHVGCLPVIDDARRPIGVITKSDLLEQLDAAMAAASVTHGASPRELHPEHVHARVAEQVMMPLALTLPEDATVAHAASLMISEDTHHVLVVAPTGALVGVISTRDVVGWIVDNDQLFGASSEPAG